MLVATFFNDKKRNSRTRRLFLFFAFAYNSNISILNFDGALSL